MEERKDLALSLVLNANNLQLYSEDRQKVQSLMHSLQQFSHDVSKKFEIWNMKKGS